ncbi:MAG: phosphotransferase [Zoogloeaceae bacterium]|jgi:aminoglycoside/choline kinase family phosphotransferase|nr:phosphotransferase [Zoogloeaceae bacterium]
MSRDQQMRAWITERLAPLHPDEIPGATIRIAPITGDASSRRYFRLTLPDQGTRVLMDAPPDTEDCRPFVRVAELMREAGVYVPQVEIADFERGFLLLADLGRVTYLDALRGTPEQADALMRPALDTLVRWQAASRPGVLPLYDTALLRREMDLFPEWYVGHHLEITLSDKQRDTLEKVCATLTASALAQPQVFVHRDFMPRNLMVAESDAAPAPGVLDFQDAVYGPIAYDVVSLFRDAFISWEEEQELDWVIRYWEKARAAGLPVHADFADFWRAYEWMGLQRHLKVLGIFCRLKYRDGKENYITDLPRFLDYARKTAQRYREFAPLAALLDVLEESAPLGTPANVKARH